MFNKFFVLLFFIFTCIFAIPLNTYADNTSIVLGVNYRIINYSYDEVVKGYRESCSSSQNSGTFQTNSNVTMQNNGYEYNGSPIYSTQSPIKGTFSLNGNSSCTLTANNSSVNERSVLEYEIVFDNYYIGQLTMTVNGVSSVLYVNGNSVKGSYLGFGSTGGNLDFSISNMSLSSNPNQVYNFPVESFPYISNCYNFQLANVHKSFNWSYPVFKTKIGDNIMVDPSNYSYVIFYINQDIWSFDRLKQFVTLIDWGDVDFSVVEGAYSLISLKSDNGGVNKEIIVKKDNVSFIPIYRGYTTFKNFSMDFALAFGLSNSMLDNIDKIVNGTSNSNSSSNDLNNNNQEFKNQTQAVENIENQYSQGLNNNLDNIDTNYDYNVNGGGSYFNNSIKWVNQQFNLMVNKTPFGTLLGFSLILGISLLVIGRILR